MRDRHEHPGPLIEAIESQGRIVQAQVVTLSPH